MPPLPADREAVEAAAPDRASPCSYVANKIDNPARRGRGARSSTGSASTSCIEVCALHGRGVGDLEQALSRRAAGSAERAPTQRDAERLPRIAIVGRPNAGKSSLVNRLLGEERLLVDDAPRHHARQRRHARTSADGAPLVLIDTAGIRRKRAVEEGLEALAVMQAIRAIERSHIVVLMIDAQEGASQQDARIAGMALDRGRAHRHRA